MTRKAWLLQSASAIAAVAVGSNQSAAADLGDTPPDIPNGYTLSLEGGALFGDPSASLEKLGYTSSSGPFSDFSAGGFSVNLDDELGYYGGIRLGRRVNPNWDVTFGAAISRLLHNSDSSGASFSGSTTSGGSGSGVSGFLGLGLETDLDYETMDFEIGYRPDMMGNLDLRLFAGLRGLHSKDSVDKSGQFSFSGYTFSGGSSSSTSAGDISFDEEVDGEFLGIGPRIGLGIAPRMSDGQLGLSGMVAGAAIFGTRRTDTSLSATGFGDASGFGGTEKFNDSESDTIYNLEGALGIDWYLGEQSKLTVGYRGQKFWDIRSVDKSGSGFSFDADQLVHGPFLLLEVGF